jgi:hypothetical protein
MATITASDYTVEIKIQKKDYLRWYDEEYKLQDTSVPVSFAFKTKLIKEIERELTNYL